jgi:uncharacterized protein (TIGR00266 family)
MTTTPSGLGYRIDHRPDVALLTVALDAGQTLQSEPQAMAWMSPTLDLTAGFRGGLGASFGRALSGESLALTTFTARDRGEVALASGQPGDIVYHRLEGQSLLLQRGAYLASSDGVSIAASWQGARGFFSGEGLILQRATGHGDLWFSSYGGILPLSVADQYYVDTGYVVAFEESLTYEVTVLPGLKVTDRVKSFLFGGEGLVCRFSGQGRLWIQTRYVNPLLNWIWPFRRTRSNN